MAEQIELQSGQLGEQPPPGLETMPQVEQEPPVLPPTPMSRNQQTQTEAEDAARARTTSQPSTLPEGQTYFALDANLIDAAISAVKTRLGERDSVIRNAWVLTEIDHWDWEKERLVLLTNSNIIVAKYNFIRSLVQELKFIPLKYVLELTYGDFKYTSSFVFSRKAKGIKISWGREDHVGFRERWNPFSTTNQIPYTIFASHVLVRKGIADEPRLQVENAVYELEQAIQDAKRAASSSQQARPSTEAATEEFKIKETEIVCDTYFGFTALLHNGSNVGFYKRRGVMNWGFPKVYAVDMALPVTYKYKTLVSDEAQRKTEGLKVRKRFPAKIPLVVGRVNRSDLPELDKSKFLFPATAQVGDLCQYINSRMRRPDHAPLFIYVQNEVIVSQQQTMAELYQEYREDDYFLYLAYFEENIHSSSSESKS